MTPYSSIVVNRGGRPKKLGAIKRIHKNIRIRQRGNKNKLAVKQKSLCCSLLSSPAPSSPAAATVPFPSCLHAASSFPSCYLSPSHPPNSMFPSFTATFSASFLLTPPAITSSSLALSVTCPLVLYCLLPIASSSLSVTIHHFLLLWLPSLSAGPTSYPTLHCY